MAVNLVKTHLGLQLLWSASRRRRRQVWAVLAVARCAGAAGRGGGAGGGRHLRGLAAAPGPLPAPVRRRGLDPVAAFVADGRRLGFTPSRRTQIVTPTIPATHLRPPPDGLVLRRTPRYARKD